MTENDMNENKVNDEDDYDTRKDEIDKEEWKDLNDTTLFKSRGSFDDMYPQPYNFVQTPVSSLSSSPNFQMNSNELITRSVNNDMPSRNNKEESSEEKDFTSIKSSMTLYDIYEQDSPSYSSSDSDDDLDLKGVFLLLDQGLTIPKHTGRTNSFNESDVT